MKLGMIRRVGVYCGSRFYCPACCRIGISSICQCGKRCDRLS
jgi:hypothetical protein